MIEEIGTKLLEQLGLPVTPEGAQKAGQAVLAANNQFMNAVFKMRDAQKKYFAGQRMILPLAQHLEKDVDKQLSTLINEKKQPKLF